MVSKFCRKYGRIKEVVKTVGYRIDRLQSLCVERKGGMPPDVSDGRMCLYSLGWSLSLHLGRVGGSLFRFGHGFLCSFVRLHTSESTLEDLQGQETSCCTPEKEVEGSKDGSSASRGADLALADKELAEED